MDTRSLNEADMVMNIAPTVRVYTLLTVLTGCGLLTACSTPPTAETPEEKTTVE